MLVDLPAAALFVSPVAIEGPVSAREVRDLARRLDLTARAHGTASVLLDVSRATGPVPTPTRQRPLACPGSIVRAAVVGEGEWAAWAEAFLDALVAPTPRVFATPEAAQAALYVRTFPEPPAPASGDGAAGEPTVRACT